VKYLVVLAVFALVVGYAYWRLRPYIRGARRVFATLREVRRMQQAARPPDAQGGSKPKAVANERLVRCAACGTWTPASRAVKLGGGATYCSHSCLERAADSSQHARKSAS
jgi:hypothetical protein